jgi:hypothetical protein
VTAADRLRAAADTIERTATAATRGTWFADCSGVYDGPPGSPDAVTEVAVCYDTGEAADGSDDRSYADAAHVALWDPPTALLVAASLRETAERGDLRPGFTLGGAAAAFVDAILAEAEVAL